MRDLAKKAAYNKAWRLANPEYGRRSAKAWADANVEKHRANAKAWAKANPVRAKANLLAWKAANPDYNKKWAEAHPGYHTAKANKRKAIKRNATIEPFTTSELTTHIEELGGRCVYCGGPYEHLDHVYPLSKGGAHALSNLVPCCKPCNLSKGSKLPLQWMLENVNNNV